MIDRDAVSTIPSPAPDPDDSCVGHEVVLPDLHEGYLFANSWGQTFGSINGDQLELMWELQAIQQKDLGLAPDDLGEVERRHAFSDLITHLHEEVSELSRCVPVHKRHVLRIPAVHKSAVAEEIADIFKCTIAAAQMHGITPFELYTAFADKTIAIKQKAEAERLALQNETRVLCFDLDDVIIDLSPWRRELGFSDERELSAMERLHAMETLKTGFYEGGRFRDMLPLPGAVETIQAAKAEGFVIAIITARPQLQFKRLRSDTVHSLNKHGIPFDLLIFNRNKVEGIQENISPAWPVFFVEDMEKNARDLAAAGVKVLLFSQPHNAGVSIPGVKRVSSWAEIRMEF